MLKCVILVKKRKTKHILTPKPGNVSSAGTLGGLVLHLEKKNTQEKAPKCIYISRS